jgi:hypothetical protein
LTSKEQIYKSNLRIDLYNKLFTNLQKRIAFYLVNLDIYNKLVVCYLSFDTELQRINTHVNRQKRLTKGKSCTDIIMSKTFTLASTSALFKSTSFVLYMSTSLKPTC